MEKSFEQEFYFPFFRLDPVIVQIEKPKKFFMFEDFFPYKYSILNFTEIERAQRDLSIPVKIKTFRLKLKEL
jgi:hypothetical protein